MSIARSANKIPPSTPLPLIFIYKISLASEPRFRSILHTVPAYPSNSSDMIDRQTRYAIPNLADRIFAIPKGSVDEYPVGRIDIYAISSICPRDKRLESLATSNTDLGEAGGDDTPVEA